MKSTNRKTAVGVWIGRALGALVIAFSLVFTLSLAASAETPTAETAEEELAAEPNENGFFSSAFAFLTEHLPLLLSSMTLIGTAVLARLFRSSLLPILDSGMKRVGGGVEVLEGKTKALLEASEREISSLSALVSRLADETAAEGERQSELRCELSASVGRLFESLQGEAARLDAVLLMLKEVFTAARLPAASKLALEEIYQKTPHGECRVSKPAAESEGSR